MRRQHATLSTLAFLALAACGGASAPSTPTPAPTPTPTPAPAAFDRSRLAGFEALPAWAGDRPSDARIVLGRALYHDARLSKNQDVACASCHVLDRYGVDGAPTSTGHRGQKGGRNAPTTFHAALHTTQFWDGRMATVEDQAKGPVTNPIEMAMPDAAAVEVVLRNIPGYAPMFQAAFPDVKDNISFDTMAQAIAAFERGLLTPSPWDAFLGGDDTALNDAQKAGLTAFLDAGCQACHSGVALGGATFMKLGLVEPYPGLTDAGRFEVTKNEADRGAFKVPSLRNIEKTGPYFHDGSVATLDEAVLLMAKHQLGKSLTPEQVASIRTFLGALTGPLDAGYITAPTLPESGPTTPKPDPS